MFDMYDDELLVEDTLLENEIDSEVELEAAMEIVDIQLEAETEDDDAEDLEEYGESCKGKKGCTELDDDLDDDDDEIEEALSLMDYDY